MTRRSPRSSLLAALLAVLSGLLLGVPLSAQAATVTHYGASCPAGTANLTTQGTPRLGSVFTVTGISLNQFCTLRACACICCPCNNCRGPSFLILGAGRSNATVNLPGLTGNGCPILATQDAVLVGDSSGNVNLTIPNRASALGLPFDLQRVDTLWISTIGSNCAQHSAMLTGVALSDGVEGVIGL